MQLRRSDAEASAAFGLFGGQHIEQDLEATFAALKRLMGNYEGMFSARRDDAGRYELWAVKDLVIGGRKRKEVFFASVIRYKSYVGFYFMPVYVEVEMKELFGPELLKLLKGKSCFHLRRIDGTLERQIEDALLGGAKLYEARGWTEI